MADRRRRILAEAQAMLEETGVEGFTIRALSRRADVAPRTLYNQFGSREDILAAAIHDHFAGLLAQLPPPPPPDDFAAQLRRMDALAERTLTLKRYATAMVGVFFSPAVDRRLYDTLHWIAEAGSLSWLAAALRDDVLIELSPLAYQRFSTLLVNTGYANVADWAAGRIPGEEMKLRMKINFLTCVLPMTRARHRTLIGGLLARLQKGEAV